MLIRRIEAIDQDTTIRYPFSMNILFIVKGQGDMDNTLFAKEDQVALLHLPSLYKPQQCIMLLVCVTR
jgi:hypothetical protein